MTYSGEEEDEVLTSRFLIADSDTLSTAKVTRQLLFIARDASFMLEELVEL